MPFAPPLGSVTPPQSTPASYQRLLIRLLPQGRVWRDVALTRLGNLLLAIGDELDRLHARILKLLDEADLRTTDEMLDAWERVAGLPDVTATIPSTSAQRRAALHAKVTATGGQSPSYFEGIADSQLDVAAGTCWVEEQPYGVPFRAGIGRAGDRLGEPAIMYYWILHAPAATGAGDQSRLEALITRLAPAHTVVEFAYDV